MGGNAEEDSREAPEVHLSLVSDIEDRMEVCIA